MGPGIRESQVGYQGKPLIEAGASEGRVPKPELGNQRLRSRNLGTNEGETSLVLNASV